MAVYLHSQFYLAYYVPWNQNLPYTVMGWARAPTPSDWTTLFAVGHVTGVNSDEIQYYAVNGKYDLYINGMGYDADNYPPFASKPDRWYHITMVRRSSTTIELYVDGLFGVRVIHDMTDRPTATRFFIGATAVPSLFWNGNVSNAKVFSSALSQSEIFAEMKSFRPISKRKLWGWYPMYRGSAGKDFSGQRNHFTEVGTTPVYIHDEVPKPVVKSKFWWFGTVGITFQYLRPSADTSLGSWTDEADGATNIYTHIDETSPSDADYVQSPNNPSTNIYKFKISTGSDPTVHTNHIVAYRYRKPDSTGTVNLKVRLVEGTTTRKEWTHNDIGTTWTTQEQTLTEGEAATITDYGNLYLELEA